MKKEAVMRTRGASVRGVGAAAVVTTLLTLWPVPGLAQPDTHVGTWVLNVAKSKYNPGPPPKEQTTVMEAAGNGIKVTTKGVDAAGKPTSASYTANFDGKDNPVTGNPDWDMTSIKRVNANTLEFTRKKAGKVVQTATSVISSDGKTRTITSTGVDAQGRKINNVAVYDKK
jgi:hypothetical protein